MSNDASAWIASLNDDLALRRDGVRVVVDALLRRRVCDYVDVAVLVDVIEKGLGEAYVERIVADHLVPSRARVRALLEARTDSQVGERVSDTTRASLRDQLATMDLPRFEWLRGAVDGALISELFVPIWHDVFSSFMKRFGAVGEGALGIGSKFAGALSKVSGAAMRGTGVSVSAQSFAATTTDHVRELLMQRLRTEDGQRIAEEIRKQLFDRVMNTDGVVILDDLERMPIHGLLGFVAPVLSHNVASGFGRAFIRTELEAAVAVEGQRTVEALLTEAGTLPDVRAYLRVVGEGCLEALLEDDAFSVWMARWSAAVTAGKGA